MDLFNILFCKDISLEELSDTFGYDEDTIIEMLEGKLEMAEEETKVLNNLIKDKSIIKQ